MKKILSLLLLLVFPVVMFTACGKKPQKWKLSLDLQSGIELCVGDEVLANNKTINSWKNGKEISIYVYEGVDVFNENLKFFANGKQLEISVDDDFKNGEFDETGKQLYGSVNLSSVKGDVTLAVAINTNSIQFLERVDSQISFVAPNKNIGSYYLFELGLHDITATIEFSKLNNNKDLHLVIDGGNVTLFDILAGSPTPEYSNGERFTEIEVNAETIVKIIYSDKGSENLEITNINEIKRVEVILSLYSDIAIEVFQG